MTICPNCSHQNPPGATQCEACFTPLPATTNCPNCGATVQLDATFCGQCGTSIKGTNSPLPAALPTPPVVEAEESALPPTIIAGAAAQAATPFVAPPEVTAEIATPELTPITVPPVVVPPAFNSPPEIELEPVQNLSVPASNEPVTEPSTPVIAEQQQTPPISSTQLQQQRYQLTHVQSGKVLEIPMHLTVVHIGKPNDQVPPDIDVSGFPCSEVVSRIHADIRIDGDAVYLEDISSANGTYVNHNALPKGNRHLLRVGDRIGLGKGDLVTFLFQEI